MKVGSFTAEILSEGRFEVFEDGHINRTPLESRPERAGGIISPESSEVGINPVLIRTGKQNILLDAGLGWGLDASSENKGVSNIRTNLSIFGLRPEDITHVILSHLHYDHMAGCSYTDSEYKVQPTFPNATYFVNEWEWEHALSHVDQRQEKIDAGYHLDDFYRLIADGRVELLNGDKTELLEGITVIPTSGHTPGHQIVQIQSENQYAYYMGDIFHSEGHENTFPKRESNEQPVGAWVHRQLIFKQAIKQDAIFFLYHSLFGASGRITADKTTEDAFVFEEQTF